MRDAGDRTTAPFEEAAVLESASRKVKSLGLTRKKAR